MKLIVYLLPILSTTLMFPFAKYSDETTSTTLNQDQVSPKPGQGEKVTLINGKSSFEEHQTITTVHGTNVEWNRDNTSMLNQVTEKLKEKMTSSTPIKETKMTTPNSNHQTKNDLSKRYTFISRLCSGNFTELNIPGISEPVHIISLIITMIGVLGNLITMIKISTYKLLWKPFYMSVFSLALADFLSIIVTYGLAFWSSEIMISVSCKLNATWVPIFAQLSTEVNSTCNIILIGSIRYVMVVYPLKARAYLTNRKVIIASFISFVAGVCLAFGLSKPTNGSKQSTTLLVRHLTAILAPSAVLIAMHIRKIMALRQSLSVRNYSGKMTAMVVLILAIYISSNMMKALSSVFLIVGGLAYSIYVKQFGNIVALINYSSNPVIYFFFSPPILKYFKCCNQNTDVQGSDQ